MEDFKKQVKKLLDGDFDSFKTSDLIAPDKADQVLKSLGFEQKSFDSNGWQWDFWMEYSKDGNTYTLAGSGWYNDGLTFSKDI